MEKCKLKVGDTFYRLGSDYFTKETVYMCNDEAFISKRTFDSCLIEAARNQLLYKDENITWTRTFEKAKKLLNAAELSDDSDDYFNDYWEVRKYANHD